MNNKENEETKAILNELFGNEQKAKNFYSQIPVEYKIENKTRNIIFTMGHNLCDYCEKHEMFKDCKHIIKRMIGECNQAWGEIDLSRVRIRKEVDKNE